MMRALFTTLMPSTASTANRAPRRHALTWLRRPALRVAAATLTLLAVAGHGAHAAVPAGPGAWQNGPNFPFFPVHLHLMANNKVMMWPGDAGVSGNDPRVWDPATGSVNFLAKPNYDIFCSGHSFLPDGRLFVAGGHISNDVGLKEAAIYNPVTNTWTRQPQMNLGRWYPTNTTLPNGDVLVVSGDVDLNYGTDTLPQVWQAATGTWRNLTNAQLRMLLYPYMLVAPNGKVFNAGPAVTTRYLDTNGAGAWSYVANRVVNVVRDYGSAVMYAPGKILMAGGGDPATATAEVIDLNAATPQWRQVASMHTARRQMNATLLPDGKVLVTGGTFGPGFNNEDPAYSVYTAEIWDPATEQWTVQSSAKIPRIYHSNAMLMPDGRVITTGGNGYTQAEYFSPPYLSAEAGARPSISSAPDEVTKGQTFFVGTPDSTSVDTVSWIRLPSVTHTLNMNQGAARSTAITRVAGGINIAAPDLTTVPPGHYMLFLLRGGVPSVAKIVHLNATSPNLAFSGTPIARVTAPTGSGSRNLGVIRDGVKPAVGSTDSTTQYDTYDGNNTAAEDWIGYQYGGTQAFGRIVFQEGRHFADGGWFKNLNVQVRRSGVWTNVAALNVAPAYPGVNNGATFESYTLRFTQTTGDAIRIVGAPGGSSAFISVGELEVYGN